MNSALIRYLLKQLRKAGKDFSQMARTANEIATELADTKAKFDAYKASADAKFTEDAAKIADLEAQLAAVVPAEDLAGVDAASADLAGDVGGATVPV